MTSPRLGARHIRRSWRGTVIGAALAVLAVTVSGPALAQDAESEVAQPDERAEAILEDTLALAPDAPPASDDAFADLVGRLRAIAVEREGSRVFLRADGAVPYADVVQIMGALNKGGFDNIGLVTDTGGPSLDEPEG